MRCLLSAAIAAFFACSGAAAEPDYPQGQLPEGVTPTRYAVNLTIIPEEQRFSGHVTIDVDLTEATSLIWLHGQDLDVSETFVIGPDGKKIKAAFEEIAGSGGVAKVTTTKPITAGKAKIDITYTAPFNRQLEGLYRSDEGGDSYAFTQMEPIFARLAFPSFDEPRFKTPFDTTLTVRDAHVAVSNTPVVKEEKVKGGLKKLTFATSKPLPTYLIAFAVGPLDVVEWTPIPTTDIRDFEIPLRGIAARGKGKLMSYALENTAPLLIILENYFGIPYPYEKLDLIAATDFAFGAMENAGAIVYREVLMLFEDNAPLSQKRRYALVHAHELAHQWFGNLVTPAWWNDIWLNEAFATWMEYRAAREWDPQGEYNRLSLAGSLAAMGSDQWRSARQIAQPVRNNDDISNAFDSITYDKGGGVLDMFERYYGAEAFRRGVKLHMQRYRFGIATSKDFLQSIADANGDTEGVAAFQTFLNQPGVPLVQAELSCKGKTAALNLRQSRYDVASAPAEGRDKTWNIPMCVAFGDGKTRGQTCEIVKGQTAAFDLKAPSCPAWIMPNADGAGYFRFAMNDAQWAALLKNAQSLTEKEVLSALDSLEAAFMAGDMDVDRYLDRVQALLNRGGQMPSWDIATAPISRITWIKDHLASDKKQAKAFLTKLYGPIYDTVGLDPTSDFDKANPVQATLMRTPIVNVIAIHAGRTDVRAELAKRGAAYLGLNGDGKLNPAAIDPSLVEQALVVAVQDTGAPVVDLIIEHLKTERSAITRSRMLTALTRSTDPAIAEKVRALALSPDLRVNEVPILVYGAVREDANSAAGWAWFKANIDAISKRTPPNNLGELASVGARFCTASERDDFKAFFTPRIDSMTGGPRILSQTLEEIDACITLVDRQRSKAAKYFAKM